MTRHIGFGIDWLLSVDDSTLTKAFDISDAKSIREQLEEMKSEGYTVLVPHTCDNYGFHGCNGHDKKAVQ